MGEAADGGAGVVYAELAARPRGEEAVARGWGHVAAEREQLGDGGVGGSWGAVGGGAGGW